MDGVVTDASDATAVNAAVAQHVRALRHDRGWSLDELSRRSRVSKGMVVQVEAARTNPSIGTLCRLANAFGVTVGRLIEPVASRTVRVHDAESTPIIWRGGYGGIGRLLAGVYRPDPVELWEWVLAPGDRHASPEHSPGSRELLHVLAGTVVVDVDGDEYKVHSGQTIEFHADRGHEFRNDDSGPARFVLVVVSPCRDA